MPKSRGSLGLENTAEVDRDPRLLQCGFFLVFRGSAGAASGSPGVFPREPERLIHSRCEAETHPHESRHRGRAPPVIQPETNHSRHREPQGNCGDFRGQLEGYCEPRTRLPLLVHVRLPPPPRSSLSTLTPRGQPLAPAGAGLDPTVRGPRGRGTTVISYCGATSPCQPLRPQFEKFFTKSPVVPRSRNRRKRKNGKGGKLDAASISRVWAGCGLSIFVHRDENRRLTDIASIWYLISSDFKQLLNPPKRRSSIRPVRPSPGTRHAVVFARTH
jgi:hypothetical protein